MVLKDKKPPLQAKLSGGRFIVLHFLIPKILKPDAKINIPPTIVTSFRRLLWVIQYLLLAHIRAVNMLHTFQEVLFPIFYLELY